MHKLPLLAVLSSACATDAVDWQDVPRVDVPSAPLADRHVDNIVGGTTFTGRPEVGLLLALDANQNVLGICSSTLVAPRILLTAAHCVDGKEVQATGFGAYFGTDATIETDPGFVFATFAESVAFHPAWDPADLAAGNDIAVVKLDRDVPIAPKRVRTAPLGAAERGAAIELVGWGLTSGGAGDSGLKRHVTSQLADFDTKLVVVGNPTTNTCNGDSGGPAFLNDQVIGVTSFGDQNCVQFGVDTRVDAFLDFLGAAGVDVTPDPKDPGEDPGNPTDPQQPGDPADPECTELFGCDSQNPDGPDDGGGCSSTRSAGNLAVGIALIALSAGRRRRRACR